MRIDRQEKIRPFPLQKNPRQLPRSSRPTTHFQPKRIPRKSILPKRSLPQKTTRPNPKIDKKMSLNISSSPTSDTNNLLHIVRKLVREGVYNNKLF